MEILNYVNKSEFNNDFYMKKMSTSTIVLEFDNKKDFVNFINEAHSKGYKRLTESCWNIVENFPEEYKGKACISLINKTLGYSNSQYYKEYNYEIVSYKDVNIIWPNC
jgi:hypothetical protein